MKNILLLSAVFWLVGCGINPTIDVDDVNNRVWKLNQISQNEDLEERYSLVRNFLLPAMSSPKSYGDPECVIKKILKWEEGHPRNGKFYDVYGDVCSITKKAIFYLVSEKDKRFESNLLSLMDDPYPHNVKSSACYVRHVQESSGISWEVIRSIPKKCLPYYS